MKHGILAKIPVIPGIENQNEWDQFVIDLKSNLKPLGVLENTLVESLAGYFWKKQRLIRYENNMIKYKIENIKNKADSLLSTYYEQLYKNSKDYVDPDQSKLEELRSNEKDFADSQKAFENFSNWPDDKEMEGNDAVLIVGSVLELIYAIKKNKGEDLPDTPYDLFNVDEVVVGFWDTEKKVTANQVIDVIIKIGEKFGYDPGELEGATRAYVSKTLRDIKKQIKIVDESIEELSNEELFDNLYSGKVMKMDAQLNRAIMQTLHEHQRHQAMRIGMTGPPSVLDIAGIENV